MCAHACRCLLRLESKRSAGTEVTSGCEYYAMDAEIYFAASGIVIYDLEGGAVSSAHVCSI